MLGVLSYIFTSDKCVTGNEYHIRVVLIILKTDFFRTTHKTSHAMNLPSTRSELYCLTDLQFLPVACLRSWYVLYKLCQML